MKITARCDSPGCPTVYESTPVKDLRHAINARLKAQRLAQEHAVDSGHVVEITDGKATALVACRCARCGKATPGNASGLCSSCAFDRLDSLPGER